MPENSVAALLFSYEKQLAGAGVDSPRLCAEMIVGEAARMGRAQLIAFGERLLSDPELSLAEGMLLRRLKGEPMAYILGRKEFYGYDFSVGPAVLVPRPETELLVDLALGEFERSASVRFADLGCGSGCIIAALLKEAEGWHGIGVDISLPALEICAYNLCNLLGTEAGANFSLCPCSENIDTDFAASPRFRLIQSDFTVSNCLPIAGLDLIVSNPPYIPSHEYLHLNFEVKNFEPRQALESGADGLEHPRAVARVAAGALKPGGLLLMEIGCEQGEAAQELFASSVWREAEIIPDLSGLDRVVRARLA
ncbi:MAG: peptide chain release factor N(5)-glutamine methyltransferase [Desulfovibrionaceae bacterium]|nr:peptide chain release factor N(5)-glutamine methyltransferase [Desulfovibrionaceae bacterium]